jgi:nucleotide-binding universal stress UspA family protein
MLNAAADRLTASAKEILIIGKTSNKSRVRLRTIIAATDFSDHSVSVLRHAAAIARRHRSTLYIVHIIPTDVYKSVPAEVMADALKQTRAYVKDAMSNQLRLDFLQVVKHESIIGEGQVAPELLKLTTERNASLLVIGTRGHHGLERLLEGSVAEELFREASCPVLIVPPRADERSGLPVRTILYPTSFSQNSLRASPYAFSLARTHRARLILLYVVPEDAIQSQSDMARLRANGEERLKRLLPAKERFAQAPLLSVEFGPVEKRIVGTAVENNADLIVLGIAAASASTAHLPEGITYKVVAEAPSPVLAIRG